MFQGSILCNYYVCIYDGGGYTSHGHHVLVHPENECLPDKLQIHTKV